MKITKVTGAGQQHLAVGTWHLATNKRRDTFWTARLSLLASGIVKFICGPVAQLDRANGYEPLGREFESLRAHHTPPGNPLVRSESNPLSQQRPRRFLKETNVVIRSIVTFACPVNPICGRIVNSLAEL